MKFVCGVLAARSRDINDEYARWNDSTAAQHSRILDSAFSIAEEMSTTADTERAHWLALLQLSASLKKAPVPPKDVVLQELRSLIKEAGCLSDCKS